MKNTAIMNPARAMTLTLVLLMPFSLVAQDEPSNGAVDSAVAEFDGEFSDASQLSSVVDEILRKLLGEIRGDVAVLRKAAEKRADVSTREKKSLSGDVKSAPDIKSKILIPARQSVLLDEGKRISRVDVADLTTVNPIPVTAEQIRLVGMKSGTTTVTVWFDGSRDPLIILASVFEAPVEPVSLDVSHSLAQSQVYQSIEEALDEQTEIDAIDLPLIEVIRQLQDASGQNIVIDLPAIEEEGVTTSTVVNLQLRGVTLRSALKILLSEFNLTWVVENEVIKITSVMRAMGALDVRAYRVGRLLVAGEDKDQQLDHLIELVQSTIEPDSWDEVGGPGSIKSFPGGNSVFVRQHQSVHHRIELLLTSMGRLMNPSSNAETPLQDDGAALERNALDVKVANGFSQTTVKDETSPEIWHPLTTTRPSNGRVSRFEMDRLKLKPKVASGPPRVQVTEGLYIETGTETASQGTVPMVLKMYQPSPELLLVFSRKGSSKVDDLHSLITHLKSEINPESWKSPRPKADVVFGDRIVIFHTPGTHDRVSRLLERMQKDAPVEDFKLEPVEIERR